jgi:hypothetical protein
MALGKMFVEMLIGKGKGGSSLANTNLKYGTRNHWLARLARIVARVRNLDAARTRRSLTLAVRSAEKTVWKSVSSVVRDAINPKMFMPSHAFRG